MATDPFVLALCFALGLLLAALVNVIDPSGGRHR